jgi:hypothetical protein
MLRWLLIGGCVLILCGCVNRWENASKRPSEFYADDRDCQAIAGSASQGLDPGSDRISYESCMWDRGWHKKQTIWFFDPTPK